MNFWVSTILTISEGWKGCGRGQTFSQKFVFLSFKQICMHFEFQPLLTISKGVGRGFKLLVVWPSLEVNIQPPATFPHLVVGVLHQTFTHFGGCGKGVGSGGSNVCFSYFLLIEKKKWTNFEFQTLKPFLRGGKGGGDLGPTFYPFQRGWKRWWFKCLVKNIVFLIFYSLFRMIQKNFMGLSFDYF